MIKFANRQQTKVHNRLVKGRGEPVAGRGDRSGRTIPFSLPLHRSFLTRDSSAWWKPISYEHLILPLTPEHFENRITSALGLLHLLQNGRGTTGNCAFAHPLDSANCERIPFVRAVGKLYDETCITFAIAVSKARSCGLAGEMCLF